jgi:hypothetical protein
MNDLVMFAIFDILDGSRSCLPWSSFSF